MEQVIQLDDLKITIHGLRIDKRILILYHAVCCCTFGILYVINHWVKYYPYYVRESGSFSNASHVRLKNSAENVIIPLIVSSQGVWMSLDEGNIPLSNGSNDTAVCFVYRCFRFILDYPSGLFVPTSNINPFNDFMVRDLRGGLKHDVVDARTDSFGINSVMIPEKSTLEILVNEVLHPFTIFQILSVCLWLSDEYYYYATGILVITAFSTLLTLIETKRNYSHLREICHIDCKIRCKRNDEISDIDSELLVPGDVVEIENNNLIIPCDILLISGDCLMNESMLTGESTLVSKVPVAENFLLSNALFNKSDLSRSVLFHGTKLARAKSSSFGIVLSTGFNTSKGTLIRSILFPKSTNFEFYSESIKFVIFLFCVALIGFVLAIYNFVKVGNSWFSIVKRSLDIFTIVVPPALPATLSIGMTYSLKRLRKQGVSCISPTKVNVGGRLNCICFDKTGTLTEEGLEVVGLLSATAEHAPLSKMLTEISELDSLAHPLLVSALCCCQNLRELNGEYVGDPIDMRLFEFVNAHMHEHWSDELQSHSIFVTRKVDGEDEKYHILSCNEFVSRLRRMSSIIQHPNGQVFSFVKGAPEVIYDLCLPSSIPNDYHSRLRSLTDRGYRIISLAFKSVGRLDLRDRHYQESDLTFLGFAVMENKVKSTAPKVLSVLNSSKIFCVMSTGDNMSTSLTVALNSKLIVEKCMILEAELSQNGSHRVLHWKPYNVEVNETVYTSDQIFSSAFKQDFVLVMNGHCFQYIVDERPEGYEKLLCRAKIFARMSPEQKTKLVEMLKAIGFCVGMVGDGSNDVGALAAADVGVSLSDADASVAAPFTANKESDLNGVLEVIREGRASLVTSFSCFKYMSLYSLIQFTSVSLLYFFGSSLADLQFSYIDIVIVLPLAMTMGRSKPLTKIVAKRPSSRLLSSKLLTSLLGHLFFQIFTQVAIFFLVKLQANYKFMPPPKNVKNTPSFENSALFVYANFLYVIYACVFSIGEPYRESAWKNHFFVGSCFVSILFNMIFLFLENSAFEGFFSLVPLQFDFRMLIFSFAIIGGLASWILECYLFPFLASSVFNCKKSRNGVSLLF